MSEEKDTMDWLKLQELMTKQMNWASLNVTIEAISQDNKALINDLSDYDLPNTVSILASLLTIPEYQSHCIRFEILLTLAMLHSKGKKKANLRQVVRWFSEIGKSKCVLGEDPAENVFVSIIQDPLHGDYRIIEGIWEEAGFYTQRIFEVVTTMPENGHYGQIKRHVRALLKISDIICENSGLHRYQLGSDECHTTLISAQLPEHNTLISRVTISLRELNTYGIKPVDIDPFIFNLDKTKKLRDQQIKFSTLNRYPLLKIDQERIIIILPSAISIAIRHYLIEKIIGNGWENNFDKNLAEIYAHTLYYTPLLGERIGVPIKWNKIGIGRCATCNFEIDRNYVISLCLCLPSIEIHTPGCFKEILEDKGTITIAIQNSVDALLQYYDAKENFKSGMVIIVVCGWGKGYVLQDIKIQHSKWRIEYIPVPDLVRASYLPDMSPLYFWRLMDGLEIIKKAGVNIVNPSGILNLIGWVSKNDGHFVPHNQLTDSQVRPDQQ